MIPPVTKGAERIQRQNPGINKIVAACPELNISYSKYTDSMNRNKAAKELTESLDIDLNLLNRTALHSGRRQMRGQLLT